MPIGYQRQSSASIVNGNIVYAEQLNSEFNKVESAFDTVDGHNHDGTTGGGAPVPIVGGTSGTLTVGRGGTGATNASAARTNLGVTIGSDVQAWDANLDQIAALTPTNSRFIVGNGSAWVVESGSTVRASLGLGSMATQDLNNVNIDGGSITGASISGIPDLAVTDGGTGASNATGARANLEVPHRTGIETAFQRVGSGSAYIESHQIIWGAGEHRLTNNDGGGNANLRFGHYFSSGEKASQDGGGVAFIGAVDNLDGSWSIRTYGNTSKDQAMPEGARLYGDFAGNFTWDGHEIWHAGNDGPGSGLNADLLDNLNSNYFAHRSNNLSDLSSASTARSNLGLGSAATRNTGSGNGLDADTVDGFHGSEFARVNTSPTFSSRVTSQWGDNTHYGFFEVERADGTRGGYFGYGNGSSVLYLYCDAASILDVRGGTLQNNGNRVLTVNDEGAGKGLDADTLDGLHASHFLRSNGKAVDSDRLDGYNPSTNDTANTIARRDNAGDISARLFRPTFTSNNGSPNYFWTSVDVGTGNNYLRPTSVATVRGALEPSFNADRVDGVHASGFLQKGEDRAAIGSLRFENKEAGHDNTDGALFFDLSEGFFNYRSGQNYVMADGGNLNGGTDISISGGVGADSGPITISTNFAGNNWNNGWTRLPNGLYLQWGRHNAGNNEVRSVTFPTTFPNRCHLVSLTPEANGITISGNLNLDGNPSKSGFTYRGWTGLEVIHWMAIGD